MAYENPRTRLEGRPEKITLDGTDFTFVVNQRDRKSAIYRSKDSFVRIGDKEQIEPQLALHKTMETSGYPVPKLLSEGEKGNESYFIETSLGDKHLGNLFAEDVSVEGVVSDTRFEDFVTVVEKFAEAQLRTRTETRDYQGFKDGLLLDELCDELPGYKDALQAKFDEVRERTSHLPFVLSHGDLNPHNMYPDGVIDFENSFYAPYGYDLVSAISHANYMPDSKDYEFYAGYRFTPAQKREYFERLNTISVEANLPPLSQFEEDFEFCRAVWLAVRIPHTPMLQKFRFDLLINKFLKN